MRIRIKSNKERKFQVYPDNELTLQIYNLLISKLNCQVTKFEHGVNESGFIEASFSQDSSLKEVVKGLHQQLGGYYHQFGNNFLISDKADDFATF